MVKQVCHIIEDRFNLQLLEFGVLFGFSFSVDGTAIVKGVFIYTQTGKIVGGSYPYHTLNIPADKTDFENLMNQFKEKG